MHRPRGSPLSAMGCSDVLKKNGLKAAFVMPDGDEMRRKTPTYCSFFSARECFLAAPLWPSLMSSINHTAE